MTGGAGSSMVAGVLAGVQNADDGGAQVMAEVYVMTEVQVIARLQVI